MLLAGQDTWGGVLSATVTVNVQKFVLLAASAALQRTVVEPMLKNVDE